MTGERFTPTGTTTEAPVAEPTFRAPQSWIDAFIKANAQTPLAFTINGIRMRDVMLDSIMTGEILWSDVVPQKPLDPAQAEQLAHEATRLHTAFGIPDVRIAPDVAVGTWEITTRDIDPLGRSLLYWNSTLLGEPTDDIGYVTTPDQTATLDGFGDDPQSRKLLDILEMLSRNAVAAIDSEQSRAAIKRFRERVKEDKKTVAARPLLADVHIELARAVRTASHVVKEEYGIEVPEYIADYFRKDPIDED